MRIVLLGPTYPFRGGISHYTTLLCHHLRQEHDVVFLSYKRQYPAFLYPGRSQIDTGQQLLHVDSEPVFDSMNPLTWWRIAKRVRSENPDIFILNWVTPFLSIPFAYITRRVRQQTNARIVMICHNVKQHERWPAEEWLTRLTLANAHTLIVHSAEDATNARTLLPDATIKQAVLPSFSLLSSPSSSSDNAPDRIRDGSRPVLLFFGFVREYKGLRYLLEALPSVLETSPDAQLSVVGEFWDDKQPYIDLINRLGIMDHVTIVDEYVPDDSVQQYFAAADLVVLPYVSATQSAIIQLAFGAGKPVVTTNVGGLPDVVEDGETGLLVEPRNPEALAAAIVEALQTDTLARLTANVSRAAREFSWDRLTRIITEVACVGDR